MGSSSTIDISPGRIMGAMKAAVAFLNLSLHFKSSQPKLTVILSCEGRTFKYHSLPTITLFILLPYLCEIKPMIFNANISHGKTMYII